MPPARKPRVINLQEWAEPRARHQALEHLSDWGWLPSGIEALISLMSLPAGESGEATAIRLREEVCRDGVATAGKDQNRRPGREAR